MNIFTKFKLFSIFMLTICKLSLLVTFFYFSKAMITQHFKNIFIIVELASLFSFFFFFFFLIIFLKEDKQIDVFIDSHLDPLLTLLFCVPLTTCHLDNCDFFFFFFFWGYIDFLKSNSQICKCGLYRHFLFVIVACIKYLCISTLNQS